MDHLDSWDSYRATPETAMKELDEDKFIKAGKTVAINNNKFLESLCTHTACPIVWKGMFLRHYRPAARVTAFLYY